MPPRSHNVFANPVQDISNDDPFSELTGAQPPAVNVSSASFDKPSFDKLSSELFRALVEWAADGQYDADNRCIFPACGSYFGQEHELTCLHLRARAWLLRQAQDGAHPE